MTFPERAIEVHRVRMQARDQHAEFAFAARQRQCRMPEVIFEIDLPVFLPGRHQDAEARRRQRSDEHTSELQSLMRISYAVFCLQKKIIQLLTVAAQQYTSN